jgi:hypothetical protein
MARILLVLLWPAGIAIIFGAAALLVRRQSRFTAAAGGAHARRALVRAYRFDPEGM